jgi:hypothetical protein
VVKNVFASILVYEIALNPVELSTYNGVIKQSHDHNCIYHCQFVHDATRLLQVVRTSYASEITGERDVIVVTVLQSLERHTDQVVIIEFSNPNQ